MRERRREHTYNAKSGRWRKREIDRQTGRERESERWRGRAGEGGYKNREKI